MAYQLSDQTLSDLKILKLPKHVAIIMDGNGRYAERLNKPRSFGHKAGALNLTNVCRIMDAMGISYLTVYAFSTENWQRPLSEVTQLFALVSQFFDQYIDEICELGVRLRFIGEIGELPLSLQKTVKRATELTHDNNKLQLIIALNYGARQEIAKAACKFALDCELQPDLLKLKSKDLEAKFASYLWTCDLPDPDLVIRTAGELRLSNFLLWQLAYAELYSTDCLWPEFGEKEILSAIVAYNQRTRKFGGLAKS